MGFVVHMYRVGVGYRMYGRAVWWGVVGRMVCGIDVWSVVWTVVCGVGYVRCVVYGVWCHMWCDVWDVVCSM